MTHLGADPGLTATALAWVDVPDDPAVLIRLRRVAIVKGSGSPEFMVAALCDHASDWRHTGPLFTVTAEGQQVYTKRVRADTRKGGDGKVDPRVLIGLAHVSGAVAALARVPAAFPTPQEWKSNLDKVVYHEAVLLALGGEAEGWAWNVAGSARAPRLVPKSPPVGADLPGGAWLHLLDAVGLVLWRTRGKKWRQDVLALSQDPVAVNRRSVAQRAAALPDADGLLRP